ncbi:uncharacterized protein LODBEIA_P13240 [Lodderomyces beijingensis]|uniref:GATA-type domain-containing protein n=1 Tax=Lodderomyces beijingensis TaxID=1775926 RepID=A0ABP0ZIS7_9ASCO
MSTNNSEKNDTGQPPISTEPSSSQLLRQQPPPQPPPQPAVAPQVNQTIVADDGQQCSNCGTTKTPLWRRAPDGTLICNACGLYLRSNNSHRPVNLKRPPNTIAVAKEEEGSCKGDGRCNGTGGSAACKGCPAFNNRVVAKKALEKPHDSSANNSTNNSNNSSSKNNNNSNDSRQNNNPGGGGSRENDKRGQEDENSLAIACYNCDTTITPLWRRDDAGNTICNACGLFYRLHGSHRPIKMKRATIKRRKRNFSEGKSSHDAKLTKNSPVVESTTLSSPPSTAPSPVVGALTQDSSAFNRLPSIQYSLPFQRQGMAAANLHSSTSPPPPPPTMAPSVYPKYSGSGRLPNGPGPVPGPPPPPAPAPSMAPAQNSYHIPHQHHPQYLYQSLPQPINIPPINFVPGTTLPPINLQARTTSTNAIGGMERSSRESTPLAIDFTATYKRESSVVSADVDDSERLPEPGSNIPTNKSKSKETKRKFTIGGLLNN